MAKISSCNQKLHERRMQNCLLCCGQLGLTESASAKCGLKKVHAGMLGFEGQQVPFLVQTAAVAA